MDQVLVWKQFADALQKQNTTKNLQTQKLYVMLHKLQTQNDSLYAQLNQAKSQLISDSKYAQGLFQEINNIRADNQHLAQQLESAEHHLRSYAFQCGDIKIKYEALKQQIHQATLNLQSKQSEVNTLKEINKSLQSEILEIDVRRRDEKQIGIIIDNYEKIERFAKQLEAQNHQICDKNHKLELKINSLLYQQHNNKQNQHHFINRNEIPSQMMLIKQNNELIEKLTETQRLKNQYYIMVRDNGETDIYGEPMHVGGQVAKPIDREICLKIEKLKQENQKLIDNLKL